MAHSFLFELVTPERLLLSEQVVEVLLPGSQGYLTIMASHAPMMTSIIPGLVRVKSEKGERRYIVFGGFADVSLETVSLLAESATPVEDFDQAQLEKRIEEARAAFDGEADPEKRNKLEEFLHQLSTVSGVLTMA